ncbi:MAG TPA: hypothetical protein VNK50_04685 [Calidithermus sp.]|nr:hypothetical protein [Calidithermus sp.]
MTAEPVATAAALGFLLGLQHATDPDHVVAVATIVTRERGLAAGAMVGLWWGLGHALTLGLAGLAVVGFGVALPRGLTTGFELAVAAVIVALGAARVVEAVRGLAAAPAIAEDHDHGGRPALHRHPHWHLHPSRPLLRALGSRRAAARALAVGALHGLAGTAAVSLLVLATLRSLTGAAVYLAVFGAGTLLGMVALTAVMAGPVAAAARLGRAHRALVLGTGLGAVVFGLVHAARALLPS